MLEKTEGALVHIVSGSTGAGKTSYSIGLSERIGAVRFSIDEWMTSLFWMDSPQPIEYTWTIERINRCEEAIFAVVRQLGKLGTPAILDLGFTKAEHRAKFFGLAREAGLPVQLHWLDVPAEERWGRVLKRNKERGETFAMEVNRDMFDFMEGIWEPPTQDEMAAMNGLRIR
jgi:predicted kinase